MKAPIQSRTLLLQRLRDGSLMLLDYNLVSTSLGLMLEPRTVNRSSGNMQNEDVYDSSYTDIRILDHAGIAEVPGITNFQWPRVFNTQ